MADNTPAPALPSVDADGTPQIPTSNFSGSTPYYGFSASDWQGFTQVYQAGVRLWAYKQALNDGSADQTLVSAWQEYYNNPTNALAVDVILGPKYKYASFFQSIQDASNANNFKDAEQQVNAANHTRIIKGNADAKTEYAKRNPQIGIIKTDNSYSGCDITPSITVGGKTWVIGNLSSFSYSVHRDKIPVRTLGRTYAKSYVSGGVTIAGTLIFTVFDTHVLDMIRRYMVTEVQAAPGTQSSPLTQQLPPFDVTVFYRNEYGHSSYMRIYGIEITDEAQSHSINDIYLENQMQYVARDIDLMVSADEQVFRPQYLSGNNGTTFSARSLATPAYKLQVIQADQGAIGTLQSTIANLNKTILDNNTKIASLQASTPVDSETINKLKADNVSANNNIAANTAMIKSLTTKLNTSISESQVGDETSLYGSDSAALHDSPYGMTRSAVRDFPTPNLVIQQGSTGTPIAGGGVAANTNSIPDGTTDPENDE